MKKLLKIGLANAFKGASLFLLFSPSMALPLDSWLVSPPDECVDQLKNTGTMEEFLASRAYIYEVPKSKSHVAEKRLSKTSFMRLAFLNAQYYLGKSYTKPKDGTTPYLVRALYGNGSTGDFTFQWCNEDILISHLSLGKKWETNRSALILHLEKEPRNIYITVDMAE